MQSARKPRFIKDELKTFGLNPHHWEVIRPGFTAQSKTSRMILAHREDQNIQLSVKLRANPDQTIQTIETVEWKFK